jgi:hypothetical protein
MRDVMRENGHRSKSRKLRLDDIPANLTWSYTRRSEPAGTAATDSPHAQGHSGRRFVLIAGLVLLAIWATLYLLFRDWKARYQQRALRAAAYVLPAIDPLAQVNPPDIPAAAWRDAIAQTQSMLLTVTRSNLLDDQQMRTLRTEVEGAAARSLADPKRALTELASIWNYVADRGDFLLRDSRSASGERHPRPKILPPRPAQTSAKGH